MEVIQPLFRDLNQDRAAVQRIANAVSAQNKRQRLQEEEQAKKEEEEQACKSKGKEKLEDLPLPSPRPIPFPELSPDHMDTEAELKLKQEQDEEDSQEEVATLNSLVDHYKKEALEADAIRREYEAKYLEASAKLTQPEELIAKIKYEGVALLPEKEVENLKEGMHHIRQENKELNEKYQ